MNKKILVLGGYGQVGEKISHMLISKGKNIIVAGRSIKKAKSFTSDILEFAIPKQINIYNIDKNDPIFEEIYLVIMCLDQSNTRFVKLCINHKINYIDISPSYTILSEIEKLNESAKNQGVMLLLGVGIAPGLSNMLAYKLAKSFDIINSIESNLMLGIGEKHGADGIKWLVNNINKEYFIKDNGVIKKVQCFTKPKKIRLIGENKNREFYYFDLADWHIMHKTLKTENIISRFAYDVNWLTKEVGILKKIGFFYFTKFKLMGRIYERLFAFYMNVMQKFNIGSESYAVQIEIKGKKSGKPCAEKILATGKNNSLLTATVAVVAAEQVRLKETKPGVVYLEEFIVMEDLEKRLSECSQFHIYDDAKGIIL